jgi:hypothetical protein
MEHSSSCENYIRSAGQQTVRLIRTQKVYYRVHKSPSLVPILSQMNPFHTLTSYSFTIHFNTVFAPTSMSTERIFSSDFPTTNIDAFLTYSNSCYVIPLSYSPLVKTTNKSWSSSLRNISQPPVISSLLAPNALLSTLFSPSVYVIPLGQETKSHTHTQYRKPCTNVYTHCTVPNRTPRCVAS